MSCTDKERRAAYNRGYYLAHKAAMDAKSRANYLAYKPTQVARAREKRYGVTPQQYAQMLVRQDNKCAICRSSEPGGNAGQFAVDHCHDTGLVRGLPCSRCNFGVWYFRDDPTVLENAVEYLRASTPRES